MQDFFSGMMKNGWRSFSGCNLIWHFLAIGLTCLVVFSGLDWAYFVKMQNSFLNSWLFPALPLGGLLPLLLPLAFLAFGRLKKNFQAKQIGLALAQAAILGSLISSFYKAFTGRIQPPRLVTGQTVIDISHQFRFGFLRGGVFWGWPSSHATIAFAMALTIFMLYPKNKGVRFLVLAYAFYVALGVSLEIHWLSEALAGAIIGSVIGVVVGKYFQEKELLKEQKKA